MTLPSRPSQHRRSRAPIVLGLVVVLAVAVAVGAWVNQLSTPVVRAGVPTATVALPPAPTTPVATTGTTPSAAATPGSSGSSAAATSSGSATPGTSSSPSQSAPSPSKSATSTPAKPFATSTIKRSSASGLGTRHRFIVNVEKTSGLKANQVAAAIADVLNDPRGWAGDGSVQFALVNDPSKADFTVYVATVAVADGTCDRTDVVCVRGKKLVLNATAWKTAAKPWGTDLAGFRRYLVNNAVGSYLGEAAASCPKKGGPAPVMAPQITDLKGCTPNPWPTR
ncbi:MAG: DUF3152 domain-containing protein [Propionicimonas sp.]|nr:DUF3152 domain-containing protein [Propionicimonas sp.]MEA5119202.1 DUF3152 domain-containing protein [Propionicimonas sp.]